MGDPVFGLCAGAAFVVGLASFAYSPINSALFVHGIISVGIAIIFAIVALWLD